MCNDNDNDDNFDRTKLSSMNECKMVYCDHSQYKSIQENNQKKSNLPRSKSSVQYIVQDQGCYRLTKTNDNDDWNENPYGFFPFVCFIWLCWWWWWFVRFLSFYNDHHHQHDGLFVFLFYIVVLINFELKLNIKQQRRKNNAHYLLFKRSRGEKQNI